MSIDTEPHQQEAAPPQSGWPGHFYVRHQVMVTTVRLVLTLALVLYLASGRAVAQKLDGSQVETRVEVDAVLITAGPYGETWSLLVTNDGKAYWSFSSLQSVLGQASGQFLLSPEQLEKIHARAKSVKYQELPKLLSPTAPPFHMPDYRLTLRLDSGVQHSVRIYSPNDVTDTAALDRFWSTWNEVWELVPLRPTRK